MKVGLVNDLPLRLRDSSRNYDDTKIVDWLASGSRTDKGSYAPLDEYDLAKFEGVQWPAVQFDSTAVDSDLSSTLSIDDSISLSGSSHGSLTSDSSSQTSATSATEPSYYSDEDQPQHKDSLNTPCISERSSYTNVSGQSLPQLVSRAERECHDKYPHGDPLQNSITSASTTSDSQHPRQRRCFLRRTSCASKSQSQPQPCKLKRDTDSTDQFVTLLIVFATRLITAIWPLSACPPMMTSCFNGAGVLPLQVFIQETLKRSRTSYSTLQVALYYLILLKVQLAKRECLADQSRNPSERKQCRAMQCGRRMFLSALMLASKYLQDRNYSARAWSKISGLRSNEINENEREYLSLIDYSLHVPKETFDNWNKIVLSLSRLSKEVPHGRGGLGESDRDLGNSGSSLAFMVQGDDTFTIEWWNSIIEKLVPSIVRDSTLTDEFLSNHVPFYKDPSLSKHSGKSEDEAREFDVMPGFMDVNFSDSLKSRGDTSRSSTPQLSTQMSPSRQPSVPLQPRLRNLPTPQTTPKLGEGWDGKLNALRSLRCSASMEVLKSMRKQCLMNANLDRCPPPRPQGYELPPVRSLMRPAEASLASCSRESTPCVSSPLSIASTSSPIHARSRSSSISSVSSSSSYASSTLPRLQALDLRQSKSPLTRVSTAPASGSAYLIGQQKHNPGLAKFVDEGYGSAEEPHHKLSTTSTNSSDIAAVQILMSMSTPETSSQCITPTPQNYLDTCQGPPSISHRGHKRSHSGIESKLQSHVRSLLWQDATNTEEATTPVAAHVIPSKQWQLPCRDWAAPKRALPNATDNKRVAYCALQQYASAPNLTSRYLKDVRVSAAS